MGAAEVCGEIGEGSVGLVADAGHDGDGEAEDSAHNALIVEGGEVSGGAAAADNEGEIERIVACESSQGGDDAGGRLVTLDEGGGDDELGEGPAAGEDIAHVLNGGAGRRGDDADAAGIGGQGALSGRLEETLFLEPFAQPFEAGGLDADAFGTEEVADELELAPLGIQGDAAVREDALAGRDLGAGHVVAEEDGADGAVAVAQRKVAVAEAGTGSVRDFAHDPEVGEQLAAFKHVLEEVNELGNADWVH